MRRPKRYHSSPFLILGLIGLAAAFFVIRKLPGVGFLYMVSLAGCGAVMLYGALNFLMNRMDESAVRTLVNAVRHVMQVGALILAVGFVVVECLIVSGQKSDAEPGADYVMVLGAGLRGETPSLILSKRMDAALGYLRENPETRAVLSGGQGESEDIAEAEAMRRYLEGNGIAGERLIIEDQSTNTAENIRFSKELTEDGASVVIVTSEFHLYRARSIAKKNGLDATALPAPTPYWYLKAGYYVREFFSVVAMFLGRT